MVIDDRFIISYRKNDADKLVKVTPNNEFSGF